MRTRRGKNLLIIVLIVLFMLSGLLPAAGTSIALSDDALMLKLENDRLGLYRGTQQVAQWQLPRGALSLDFSQVGDYVVVRVSLLKEGADVPSETYFCVDAKYVSNWHMEGFFDAITLAPSMMHLPNFALYVEESAFIQKLYVLAEVYVVINGEVNFMAAVSDASIEAGQSLISIATPEELAALLDEFLIEENDALPEKITYFDLSKYKNESEEDAEEVPHTPGDA